MRTWTAGDGPVSAAYDWHPLAKIWQTPGVGEQWMADFTPEDFSYQLQGLGVPAALATETAGRVDPLMKDCILRLYRSAITVGEEWEPGLESITSLGLVFWGISDQACPSSLLTVLAGKQKPLRSSSSIVDTGHH